MGHNVTYPLPTIFCLSLNCGSIETIFLRLYWDTAIVYSLEGLVGLGNLALMTSIPWSHSSRNCGTGILRSSTHVEQAPGLDYRAGVAQISEPRPVQILITQLAIEAFQLGPEGIRDDLRLINAITNRAELPFGSPPCNSPREGFHLRPFLPLVRDWLQDTGVPRNKRTKGVSDQWHYLKRKGLRNQRDGWG